MSTGKYYFKRGNTIFTEKGPIKTRLAEDGKTYREDDEYEPVPVDALRFTTFDECADEESKIWLIEGVLALEEDSSWWGPSGVGKSTLMVELGLCVASRKDWRGHRFVRDDHPDPDDPEPNGVVIFATERAKLTQRRLLANMQRDNLPADLPICVVDAPINLMDAACVNQISDTIYKFEYQHGCKVALVTFDSWSKCLGGHDEMLPHVQNNVAVNIGKIRDRYHSKFHVASVGHSGKNIEAGERGSSARRAHVDFAVKIYGEGKVKTAKVDKANDGQEGITLATFETVEFTVGGKYSTGIDRKPYTVGIMAPYDPHTPATEARTDVSKPTPRQMQALDALKRAIAARGHDGGVHADYWKEELTKAGLLKPDAKNPWQPFKRIKDSLTQHIIEVDGVVRVASPLEISTPPYPSHSPITPHTPKGVV